MMASVSASSLRSFARQCPFMQRHNAGVPQSGAALMSLASKCPITQRALAHTSAPLNQSAAVAEEKSAEPVKPRMLTPHEEDILKGVATNASCFRK
jgi:hypothetical protein